MLQPAPYVPSTPASWYYQPVLLVTLPHVPFLFLLHQSGILYLHTSVLLIISLHLSAILNHTFPVSFRCQSPCTSASDSFFTILAFHKFSCMYIVQTLFSSSRSNQLKAFLTAIRSYRLILIELMLMFSPGNAEQIGLRLFANPYVRMLIFLLSGRQSYWTTLKEPAHYSVTTVLANVDTSVGKIHVHPAMISDPITVASENGRWQQKRQQRCNMASSRVDNSIT